MSAPDKRRPDARWLFRRGLHLERWRVAVWLRAYRGHGLPQFEFEFRFGRSSGRRWQTSEEFLDALDLMDDVAIAAEVRERDARDDGTRITVEVLASEIGLTASDLVSESDAPSSASPEDSQ